MAVQYNFLTDSIDSVKLQEFSRQPQVSRALRYYGLLGALIIGLPGAFFIAPFIGFFGQALHLKGVVNVLVIGIGIIGIFVGGFFIGNIVSRQSLRRMYRLTNFAQANGWTYNQRLNNPSHAGMIFGYGHARYAKDQIFSTTGNLFEIGNYYYTTGSGKNQQTHDWGYFCIKLKRRVPNMVLDAKSNNSNLLGFHMSNLPQSLRNNATMSLEGDFDNYFTLYAPKEYERDALYIFTPELMALLIDESAKFDVEVVDDRMYVYSSTAFDMTKVATFQKIFTIINQVGEEMIDNTDYYADERVGDRQANIVAPQGARLKRSVPALLIVVVVIAILVQVLPLFMH